MRAALPAVAMLCQRISRSVFFRSSLRGVSLLGVNSVDIPVGDRSLAWQKLAHDWKLDLSGDLISECVLEELNPKIDQILKGGIRGRVVVNLIQ
jgi:acrylyl-CoA reductase (NADPH)